MKFVADYSILASAILDLKVENFNIQCFFPCSCALLFKMETILGLRTDNFCILASDMTAAHSIIVMKSNEKKIYPVSDQILMAATGQQGDAHQFAEYIVKNVQLYKMRNGYGLSTASAAHFIRQNLAEYLRSQTPYNVNLLLGGFEEKTGGQLYYMDYLASSHEVKYGSHGYGGMFAAYVLSDIR